MAKKRTPQQGSIMAETDLKKLKSHKATFLFLTIAFVILGICFFPFLFIALIFLGVYVQANKRYKEVKASQEREAFLKQRQQFLAVQKKKEAEEKKAADLIAQEERKRAREFEEAERKERRANMPEEELNRLKGMCADIYKEYKDLMKKYSKLDDCDSDDFEDVVDENVYILKECYRKLDVARTTIEHYNLQEDVSYDVYDEMVKVMKKAESFINAYIKYQRTENIDDDMIDVMQFTDDLNFIFDYIYEKDEKLNK